MKKRTKTRQPNPRETYALPLHFVKLTAIFAVHARDVGRATQSVEFAIEKVLSSTETRLEIVEHPYIDDNPTESHPHVGQRSTKGMRR